MSMVEVGLLSRAEERLTSMMPAPVGAQLACRSTVYNTNDKSHFFVFCRVAVMVDKDCTCQSRIRLIKGATELLLLC